MHWADIDVSIVRSNNISNSSIFICTYYNRQRFLSEILSANTIISGETNVLHRVKLRNTDSLCEDKNGSLTLTEVLCFVPPNS